MQDKFSPALGSENLSVPSLRQTMSSRLPGVNCASQLITLKNVKEVSLNACKDYSFFLCYTTIYLYSK